MDNERFEELFTDVERWVRQARRLKIAGDKLVPPATFLLKQILLDREGARSQSPEFLESVEFLRAYGDACALLYGLAIENACKAIQIRDGYISILDGKVLNLRLDHNLIEMVRKTHYNPTKDESNYLELLSYQVRVIARYPIAKNLEVQSKFTGRTTGGSEHEANLVNTIIIKILRDSDLVNIFMHGCLSEHPSKLKR